MATSQAFFSSLLDPVPAHAQISNTSTQANYWELHPFSVLTGLGVQVDTMKLEVAVKKESKRSPKTLSKQKEKPEEYTRTKTDIYDDAHLSFDFNLRHGVFTSLNPLTNSTKDALFDWLNLLSRTLPPAWKVHSVISVLLENFEIATESKEKLIDLLNTQPRPSKQTWSKSCTKGVPGMGYTCGLWELFHIITVGLVEWNLMIEEDQMRDIALSTTAAARTLRGFVVNFFGCEECRAHFRDEFESCMYDRCNRLNDDEDSMNLEQWIQFPLWLIETHNGVNVRLLHEKADREKLAVSHDEEVKKVWPSHEDCPKCWTEDGSRESSMFKYLRVEYW